MWGLNRSPKSLAAARSNVFAALGHLGMLTAQTCPRGLLHEVEHVLQVMTCLRAVAQPHPVGFHPVGFHSKRMY